MGLAFVNSKIINEKSLFFCLIIISLLPIWANTYFPSQDGPTHLENANIISKLISANHNIYNDYFSLNYSNASNWLLQVVLAALLLLFPILIAEKIILSGFVILFPLSFRYCLTSINPKNSFLSFISIGFIYSYTFCMGFYSFSYSMVLYFFSFGYWLRFRKDRRKPSAQNILLLGFLFLATYLLHILSFVMLFTAICINLVIDIFFIDRLNENNAGGTPASLVKNIYPLAVAVLPTAILVLFFFQNSGAAMGWDCPIWVRFERLFALFSLVCYDRLELISSIALVIIIGSVTLYVILSRQLTNLKSFLTGFFALVLLYSIVYFLSPDSISGGSLISDRLSLYLFLIFIVWLGTFRYKRWLKTSVVIISILVTLVSLYQKSIKFSEINPYIKDYMSGTELIHKSSTVLPLSYFNHGACLLDKVSIFYRIDPLINAAGYIAAQKNCVEFLNYQAGTTYFPTQWKKYRNPYVYIGKIGYLPSTIDLNSYSGTIDYVIIYCLRAELLTEEPITSLFNQLNRSYKMIYRSKYKSIYQLKTGPKTGWE